jgi:thiamine biosynthesis protein ThiI
VNDADTDPDAPETTVLCSYGEVGTKSSHVRRKMVDRLRENVAALLGDRGFDADVERRWSRLVVRAARPVAAAEAVAEVPGVVWARPAVRCAPTAAAIRDALTALAADHGETTAFAVRANRAGDPDAHGFTSTDLEREGGAAVVGATGAPVDLDDPARTYRVDCREEDAFVSRRSVAGPGGLPLGTQGRVVALVSGGIDSPVAAWETMRRGCVVVPVYVALGDYGGPDHVARALETVRPLAARAPNHDLSLRVVRAGDLVAELTETVVDTRMLSLRRLMLAAGEAVAEGAGASAVVTGECIGQKSSQTAPNVAATDDATDLPVHRPLLTRDKTDVTAMARDLGTFDDSTIPVGCERLSPPHPETNATVAAVRAAEPDDLLERARALVKEGAVDVLSP